MTVKTKGYICGIVAAVSYGTNPLGALLLYEAGVNTDSVLFYRYAIAALVLCVFLALKGESFRVSAKELCVLAVLGALFAVSSLTLFASFLYMDAGIASTLLFVYPVMVALIMAVFFKEKISAATMLSIALALGGIAMLYSGGSEGSLSAMGVVLVMVSALAYALYIVLMNRAALKMSSVKLTFFVLPFCVLTIALHSRTNENFHLQTLSTPYTWLLAAMLALVPTVISLVAMAVSVKSIGSTPTAIIGALEPLTAVLIGVTVFSEHFTARLAVGILMILLAVMTVIAAKPLASGKLFSSMASRSGKLYRRFHWK